ncbi:MAG: SPOR domain-containing protein [Firmicutes bacterium]|nr:SPOR domain-containing protein [Bacillota bacterium]
MKKYLLTFLVALIIGFFLSAFFLKQYDDFEGIKVVSSSGENLYFIQYGVFSSLESLEDNTINLQNYVYNKQDNLYYVYVGITKLEENAKKIVNYYKSLGYDAIIKEFGITNKEFLELLVNYDEVLKNTDDKTAIASIISQTLIKYEEVVISGG